jgi:hypothetical protein
MKYIPGAAPQTTSVLSGTEAFAMPQSVLASKDNKDLLACLRTKCPEQSKKVGSSWTNPVNTNLAACLADSESGLGAATDCFPPVDPSRKAEFADSTALRYCLLCASCIAGDGGSEECKKFQDKPDRSAPA